MLKTYDEWKKTGYGVLKGEKAKVRKCGECYFDETQVIHIESYYKDQIESGYRKQCNYWMGK